jgi:hypothetical protein
LYRDILDPQIDAEEPLWFARGRHRALHADGEVVLPIAQEEVGFACGGCLELLPLLLTAGGHEAATPAHGSQFDRGEVLQLGAAGIVNDGAARSESVTHNWTVTTLTSIFVLYGFREVD